MSGVARFPVPQKSVEKTLGGARLVGVAVIGFMAALALQPQTATAQETNPAAGSGFSFAVYGDSRSMMYLPYKSDQEADARQLMVDMFDLVLPEKVAAEVIQKDVKLTYDPATQELVQIVMPFDTRSEVTTLTLDKGWVTEASVEDVKLLPGVRRTMFRLQGGEWVAREIVKDVQSGRAKFVLNTGDMVWWGKQGRTVSDSPYWKLANDASMAHIRSAGRRQTLIYKKTGNLRAVQLLLGHTKIESTVRYLGIEVDDALAVAEQIDV